VTCRRKKGEAEKIMVLRVSRGTAGGQTRKEILRGSVTGGDPMEVFRGDLEAKKQRGEGEIARRTPEKRSEDEKRGRRRGEGRSDK